jgi:hypothetical protein
MERPYRGFRSSSLGGAGETDLLKVCAFEMQEMGNKDIPDTLVRLGLIRRPEEAKPYLNRLYREGYRRCVWLCDSVKQLQAAYFEGTAAPDLERWDFKGGEWKLLSEIPDGKLIAYNRLPSIT